MPPWAEALPRLFEIYRTSGHAAPGNGLQQPNVWRGLLDNSPGLEPIENDLQVLDPASWAVFQLKAARLVHLMEVKTITGSSPGAASDLVADAKVVSRRPPLAVRGAPSTKSGWDPPALPLNLD